MKIKIPLAIIITISTVILSSPAPFAQQPTPAPSPKESPFQMPDFSKMYSQMVTGLFTESIKPERAAQLAHFQKLYYDALINEGFSKEDAIEIVKGAASSFRANR
jgi:hypothetical protein